jgi:hypothetical protein
MIDHGSRAHADFGFSSMTRTRNCWGWVPFWKKRKALYEEKTGKPYVEKDSPAAKEGTRLHELGEQAILSNTLDAVPEEDRDAVGCYVDLCNEIYSLHNSDTVQFEVEVALDLSHLGADCWGTPDFVCWSPGERIDVVDAKFGRMLVDPTDNYQLLSQLLGLVEREDVSWDFKEFYVWISQPLAAHDQGPNRCWQVDISKLKLWRVELHDLLQEASKPNAILCAGDWCKWCPNIGELSGIPGCPEIELEAKALARSEFAEFDPVKPTDLQDSELAMILPIANVFRDWLDACELEGYNRKMAGDNIPEIKLVRNPGRSSIDKVAYDKFADQFEEISIFYRREPLTVTSFKKLMDEFEIEYSEWKHVVKKGEGSLKLVTGKDSRTEYIPAEVEFKDD